MAASSPRQGQAKMTLNESDDLPRISLGRDAMSAFTSAGQALTIQAEYRAEDDGLVFPISGGRMSFAEWDAASTALARSLLELGLAPGDHIALLEENRIEWPVAQIAASRAGLVLVPLNTHYRQEDLAYALAQSRSRAIILSPKIPFKRLSRDCGGAPPEVGPAGSCYDAG